MESRREIAGAFALALALAPFTAAQAVDHQVISIPEWQADPGTIPAITSSTSGTRIVFATLQPLVEDENDTELDSYLFDIATGELQLLLPQPSEGTVTLLGGNSFHARNFSSDGSRLMLGGNSSVMQAAHGSAVVVFDFEAQEYIGVSYLPEGSQAPRPGDEWLAADGKYGFFSNAEYLDGWKLTYYRRKFDDATQPTEIALEHINGGGIDEEEGMLMAVSADGGKLLFFAADGVLDSDDANGRSDYFVVDIESGLASRVDVIMADGTSFEHVSEVQPSPDFQYLLMRLGGGDVALSRLGDNFVEDRYVVYDTASGETLGLAEFLDLPEHHVVFFDTTAQGSEYAWWGETSRYMVVSQGAIMEIPGDWDADPKRYVYDRETRQAWVASIDAEGNIDRAIRPYAREAGGLMYMRTSPGTLNLEVVDTRPQVHGLVMDASTSDGSVSLVLSNETDTDVHNVALAFSYAPSAIAGSIFSDKFAECSAYATSSEERRSCRVGALPAGSSESFTFVIDADVDLTIEAVSISDPAADPAGTRATVEVSKPSEGNTGGGNSNGNDNNGGGGGGPFAPLVLVLLLPFGYLRARRKG